MRTKKIAVILLTLCMIITMTPLMSFAVTEDEAAAVSGSEASVDVAAEADNADAGKKTTSAAAEAGEDPLSADDEEAAAGVTVLGVEDIADEEGEDAAARGAGIDWADSVYVLGKQVNSSNCNDVLGDGGSVQYDRSSRTITLNNANIDLKNFDSSAFSDTNKVYGISTWQDANIVLQGSSTIVSSASSFDPGMEYVYGIEATGGLSVSGSGSLSIEIATDASGIEKYYGIEGAGRLSISGSTIDVSMNGSGDSIGIYTGWKGFALSDRAIVRAGSTGGGGRAVYDSSYMKSTVEYGSSLEMISDYAAFQFSRLSDSVADGRILINTEPTFEGADYWDKTSDLTKYKYVRLLGSNEGSRASGSVYILGRALDSGELPDDVPHSGTIAYDENSKTLTLENAAIDLDDFETASPGNLVAGIYATSDIRIVLKGENTVKSTNNDYAAGTEYVSGIEGWGTLDIMQDQSGGSLSVELAKTGSGNSKISFTGINADDSILIDSAEVNIDMGRYGRCTGIYAWKPFYLSNGAIVGVTASGSNNMAVSGTNPIGASVINGGSELEMRSDGVAFNCWTPKASLKEIDCLVSTSKDGSSAEDWDKSSSLRDYRYVKFAANKSRFGKDIRVLGRKITDENCGDVLEDGGSVTYDKDTKTLTLNNAELDFADFHHEYDDDENPESGTNMIVGIDAEDDITVVLRGRNRIFTTKDSFDEKKEYVYGIDSGMMNDLTITGEGTLEIAFEKNNEKLSYTGVDVGDSFTVDGVSVTVDLGGELGGTGIDCMMGAVKLQNGGTLRVNTDGASSKGVDSTFANDMVIKEGSLLEMTSEGKAFNNYYLSQEVTAGGALVNTEASAEGASAWNRTTYLVNYKYVRFPENYVHAHELEHFAGSAATCTEPGSREHWVCWKCGTYFSDEGSTVLDPDEIFTPKLEHEWDKGKITKPATLLRKGVKTYTCTVCHGTKEESFTLKEAIEDTAEKAVEKIIEWIEKIFGGGGSDDPDVLPAELTVTLSQDTFTYNGKVQKPDIKSVTAGGEAVENYTAEYEEGSKDAGTYKVTAKFEIGEYSISGTAEYTIKPANITDMTVSGTSFTYNGRAQKPSVVTVKAGNLKLGPSDYTAEYSDSGSSGAGEYLLKVNGRGNFCGSKTAAYSIRKAANPLSVSCKTANVQYKKLKKKNQTVRAGKVMNVSNAKGKVTYKLSSVSKAKYRKYFKLDPASGNMTVKKKLRKGTYTITAAVSASGDPNYEAGTAVVTFRIKVR